MKRIGHVLAIAASCFFAATAVSSPTSWYDAAGALAAGAMLGDQSEDRAVGEPEDSRVREDAMRFREAVETALAQCDRLAPAAGDLARQCIDASRIVEIAEHPTSVREMAFLLVVVLSLLASLFVTKILASMFKVEIAKLLWIPIGLLGTAVIAVYSAVHIAARRKALLAAGVALSAAGAVSVIDPLRHAFFGLAADALLFFTAWYVPLCMAAVSFAGLLFVGAMLMKNLGAGPWVSFALRNIAGLVAIPAVCAMVFIGIMSFVGPWFFDNVSTIEQTPEAFVGKNDFRLFPRDVRTAAAEMARAAEGVYDRRLPRGATPFDGFLGGAAKKGVSLQRWDSATGIISTKKGLVAQVVRRGSGAGNGEIAVVFRGTTPGAKDVLEDVRQYLGTGSTPQYDEAAALVSAVKEATSGPIVVLGHSLGGGLSQYSVSMNADSTRIRGVGFNSAGLSPKMIGRIESNRGEGDSIGAASRFSHVRMENDLVSSEAVQLGNVIKVPAIGTSGMASHSISTLAGEMERLSK